MFVDLAPGRAWLVDDLALKKARCAIIGPGARIVYRHCDKQV
jgi:hypothetical protein